MVDTEVEAGYQGECSILVDTRVKAGIRTKNRQEGNGGRERRRGDSGCAGRIAQRRTNVDLAPSRVDVRTAATQSVPFRFVAPLRVLLSSSLPTIVNTNTPYRPPSYLYICALLANTCHLPRPTLPTSNSHSDADPRLVANGLPHIWLPGVSTTIALPALDHDHAPRPHLFLRCRPQLESVGDRRQTARSSSAVLGLLRCRPQQAR